MAIDPMTALAIATTAFDFSSSYAPYLGYQVQSLFPQHTWFGQHIGHPAATAFGGVFGAPGALVAGLTYPGYEQEMDALKEREALAAELMSGRVPSDQYNSIANQLNAFYGDARHQLGGYMGRQGLAGSTIAAEQMANTYTEQGRDLANALADRQMQRQALGMNLLGANQDIMAQRRAEQAQVGEGITNTLSLLHENRMAQKKETAAKDPFRLDWTPSPLSAGYRQNPRQRIFFPNRPITTRAGTYQPSVKPSLSIQQNGGYGGGNRQKNTFAKVRSRTGAQQLKTPSFSGL